MLILGLLPGPNEVKVDQINHYLSPIVDILLKFWDGVDLQKTTNHQNGRTIRMAVICCSSDIPAARKLCGHISANAACHRCYKRASGDERERPNFGGFDDMDDWFRQRNLEEFRQDALAWCECRTKDERNKHVSDTLVRWTELLRLPYFNPIRHCVIDPMHNLFIGIASWIVKRLWIDGGKISQENLELMEKRSKNIKIPADLGRIPNKITTGEGFSGFTADQWKTFILVYATPIMWDLLSVPDRQILGNFVRACTLLVCRIIDNEILSEAHDRLLKVGKLIEEHYGQRLITPNIHLSLHLTECCQDYGPLYAFWCYSFERMNGKLGINPSELRLLLYCSFTDSFLLGSFPNSKRCIEPELLRIIMQNCRVDNLISIQSGNNQNLIDALELIKPRPTTGSLAAYDGFNSEELLQFRRMFRHNLDDTITGSELFPGELLNPIHDQVDLPDNLLRTLITYYGEIYDDKGFEFISMNDLFERNLQNDSSNRYVIVQPKINQCGRIRMAAEIFGSVLSYS